jgi:hypothetical protein
MSEKPVKAHRARPTHSGVDMLFAAPYQATLEDHYKKLKQLLPTPTDVEVQLAKLMGLTAYQLQMPLRQIFTEDHLIPILDLQTGKRTVKIKNKYNCGPARIMVGKDRGERNALAVRWCEYQAAINLPKDFRKQYPYLYAILRDMFGSQYLSHRDNMAIEKRLFNAQEIIKIIASAFYHFHQLMTKIPNVVNWMQDPVNKKELEVIQILEDLLQDLVDAQKPSKKVYVPP